MPALPLLSVPPTRRRRQKELEPIQVCEPFRLVRRQRPRERARQAQAARHAPWRPVVAAINRMMRAGRHMRVRRRRRIPVVLVPIVRPVHLVLRVHRQQPLLHHAAHAVEHPPAVAPGVEHRGEREGLRVERRVHVGVPGARGVFAAARVLAGCGQAGVGGGGGGGGEPEGGARRGEGRVCAWCVGWACGCCEEEEEGALGWECESGGALWGGAGGRACCCCSQRVRGKSAIAPRCQCSPSSFACVSGHRHSHQCELVGEISISCTACHAHLLLTTVGTKHGTPRWLQSTSRRWARLDHRLGAHLGMCSCDAGAITRIPVLFVILSAFIGTSVYAYEHRTPRSTVSKSELPLYIYIYGRCPTSIISYHIISYHSSHHVTELSVPGIAVAKIPLNRSSKSTAARSRSSIPVYEGHPERVPSLPFLWYRPSLKESARTDTAVNARPLGTGVKVLLQIRPRHRHGEIEAEAEARRYRLDTGMGTAPRRRGTRMGTAPRHGHSATRTRRRMEGGE
ncbi:hypothetical protein B0H13DRAFT_2264156 [Mycena leptocephala]|nr:hypothetical protein B0H13DRAFT_2264156 [Mycena leptocephala]